MRQRELVTGRHPADSRDLDVIGGAPTPAPIVQVLEVLLATTARAHEAEPGDFDCLFVYDEATEGRLKNDEQAQTLIRYHYCKARFQGDIFAFAESTVRKYPLMCRLDSFDYDKTAKQPKGVVEVKV